MRKITAALCGVTVLAAGAVLLTPTITTDSSGGDTSVTSVTVNDGRPILLGPVQAVTVPLVVTARDDSGIAGIGPIGVWGPNYGVLEVSPLSCTADGPSSVCRGTVTIEPERQQVFNDEAGTWFVDLKVRANDGDGYANQTAAGFSLKRAARMTGAGVPQQAEPGQELTVTGALARSCWDTHTYCGYQSGTAHLQFRPSGSTLWSTVATSFSDASGAVTAQAPATGPGDFQWYAPGDKWTGDAVSPALPVSVVG
ncbi:hypothetical protein F4556_005587 [Kitasatospora gansuensis]|uniref:Calcium-binding protein n=1 Tax=Kitasatospora gansuensis TaxID=258050 RepID=A0A7W7WJP8_9ACTN|nr:hypothetical protein [Kitasatospora gansuensis]MBB4950052.1 hypothetical protein [Kitasatospora gansuensis]